MLDTAIVSRINTLSQDQLRNLIDTFNLYAVGNLSDVVLNGYMCGDIPDDAILTLQ